MGNTFWIIMGVFVLFSIVSSISFFLFIKFAPKMLKGMSKSVMKVKKEIITEQEDDLKYIADKEADISKDAITKKARAVKEGFDNEESIYCKHCGSLIDADSTFCKKCGKEQ